MKCLFQFQVEFSSLNFLLHTEALLSTIKYVNSILPSELATARNPDTKKQSDKSDHGRSGKQRTTSFLVWWCFLFLVIFDP